MIRILNQSKRYNRLPSEILRIDDEYTAFCFDEACDYIITQLEQEKKPVWREQRKTKKEKRNINLQIAEKIRQERR